LVFFKFLVADRFRNIDIIENVTCPLLIIHGQKDKLIPYKHSIELSKNAGGPYELILPEDMDHNDFSMYDDFLDPICDFFKRLNLMNENSKTKITFPKEIFDIPEELMQEKEIKQTDSVSKLIRKIVNI